jgi:prepilin-type N-terminal cleavage/methylation domain-containing protein
VRSGSRGFTLVELLIAVAIAVIIGTVLLRSAIAMLHWTTLQAARNTEHAQIGELVDRLEADEDSAWAIFTPPKDVHGSSNADGHELDFFNRDGKNQAYFWAYNYDSSAQTLTRYLYSSLGGTPISDVTYSGINAFYARTYPITALKDASSKIYSPLYEGAALTPGAVTFFPGTGIAGGNQITYVRVAGPTLVRELQLSTQTAPSGFIVELQYTPAPTPTPQIALVAWPQFIELPMNGKALQTSWMPPPHDVAYYVNRLLGGGIANAALAPCGTNQGRAFTDSTFTTALTNATAPAGTLPSGVSAWTDASGCITFTSSTFTNGMPNVGISESGYTGTFTEPGTTCGLAVAIVYTYPASQQGPAADIVSQGGSSLAKQCGITWQGSSASEQATTIYEVSGCVDINSSNYELVGNGEKCKAGSAWVSTTPDCTPGGSGGIEYTPTGIAVKGPGSATDNGDGTFTMTRTGSGSISASYTYSELMCSGRGTRVVNGSANYSFAD